MDSSPEEKILDQINREELVELAVTMGNIYSPTSQEAEMAAFVYEWMDKNGFGPRLIGPTKERANVLGRYRGEGNGLALTFNSHMDVTLGKNEIWRLKVPDQKIYYQAWIEGNTIFGNGVVNDKGPMASWMVAVKALREAGVSLKGDVLMSAVVGEIGYEPVDEFAGMAYAGKDLGTRYLLTHGGSADLAIVAEATDFKPGWVEAGKAFFKVTIHAGPSRYTPYVQHGAPEESKNAIVRAALLIPILERWAKEYEERYTTHFAGGTVVPKVSIGAIRAGLPYQIIRPPEVCSLYIDVRLLPGMNPLDVREELINLVLKSGFEGGVELYLHRPGYESVGVEGLLAELGRAHERVHQSQMIFPPDPPVTSMWRDTNVYAEFGIPAINYGPGGGAGSGQNSLPIEDLFIAAKVYALTAYYAGQLSRVGRGRDGRKG
jgi:acetylornithine deacetylase/succinyl-diaminopimelate desuccinylase-like protein